MLEMILDRHLLTVVMCAVVAAGVVSKGVVSISLKSLTKAAANMGKSSHPFMRLVRAKYEHACMVSDKVQNVDVFVEKYLYEYKIAGIRLHGWRRIERGSAWGCFAAGLLEAGAWYALGGMSDYVLQSAALGAAFGIFLFLLRISMDENYRLTVIHTYMVDYLDNVCARRCEKNRELNNPERPRPREEVPAPKADPEILPPVMPEPCRVPEQNIQPEGMRLSDRVRAARERDAMEQNGPEKAAAELELAQQEMDRNVAETAEIQEAKAQRGETKGRRTSRAARKKDLLTERGMEKEAGEAANPAPSREVLIREILEEFLA